MAGAFSDWWKTTDLYKWWNSENKWGQLWDAILNGLKSAFSWMVSFGEWLTNFGKKVCEAFADWWKDSDLKKSWDGLVDKFQKFSLSETLSNLVSKLSNGIKKLLAPLADFSINLPTGFKWKDMSILKWNFKIPVGLEWKTIQPFASFAEEKPAEISQVSAAPELSQTLNSIDNGE